MCFARNNNSHFLVCINVTCNGVKIVMNSLYNAQTIKISTNRVEKSPMHCRQSEMLSKERLSLYFVLINVLPHIK